MLNKITKYLLYILVLSLGFGQLLRFDFYGLPLYLHDILTVLLLAILIPRGILYRNSLLTSKRGGVATSSSLLLGLKLFAIGLTLGWLRALTLYSIFDLLVPLLYTFRLLSYLALYFMMKKSEIKIPYTIFLLSGLVTLIIGLTQYVLLPDMRVFQYLGWDDHLNRLTLPHFDPTYTAVMLGLFVLSIINTSSIFNILVLLFSTLAILLTYSRSVWLSLTLTATFFIHPRKYILLLAPIFLVAIYLLPSRFGEGTNLLRTFSITSRLNSDANYLKKYSFDLLIGRGMNTLIRDSSPSKYDNHATGPNNSYLYLLATTGIIGLIGWGIFMYSLYAQSSHKAMIVFFCLGSIFNNVMFYPFALLWVLLINFQVATLYKIR